LVDRLNFDQEIQQEDLLLEGKFELIGFDIQIREEAMDMAAAFLVILIGSIDANNRCNFDLLAFEVELILIKREAFIEGELLQRR
jgi:hypothetical protein